MPKFRMDISMRLPAPEDDVDEFAVSHALTALMFALDEHEVEPFLTECPPAVQLSITVQSKDQLGANSRATQILRTVTKQLAAERESMQIARAVEHLHGTSVVKPSAEDNTGELVLL